MKMKARSTLLYPMLVATLLLSGCKVKANGHGEEERGGAPGSAAPAAIAERTGAAADAAPGRPRGPRAQKGASPGQFDFYVLTLSWSPEFCATHKTDPECAPRAGGPYGFLIHGLWPQNNDGTFPEHCSDAPGPVKPSAYADIIPDASLVQHEWQTHGTCSGLAADTYFGMVRRAFGEVTLPVQFTGRDEPAMLAPGEILGLFAQANPSFPKGSLALSCGNNRLTAVEACLSKDLKPIACSNVKTCRATAVKITQR